MKLNELKFWKMVVDIVVHVSLKFQIDPRSYVNGVTLQSCCDRSLFWKDIKTDFWSGVNMSQPHFGAKCENTTHTPKSGKMESSGTPENSEDNLRGQISLSWCVLYINGKVLKRKFPKWPRMGHLDICSSSYGQKKGKESNCQFDSRPLKVGNRPLPDVSSRSATWRWKALDESYNFGLDLVPIRVWGEKLWPFKVPGLQPGIVSGFQLGSPGKKSHLDVALAKSCRVYYMGEGGGFPWVRAVVSFVCQSARDLSQHLRVFSNAN
jgi:hypothetical protein